MIISFSSYRSSLFAETHYRHEHNSQSQSVKRWLSLAPPAQKQRLISAVMYKEAHIKDKQQKSVKMFFFFFYHHILLH